MSHQCKQTGQWISWQWMKELLALFCRTLNNEGNLWSYWSWLFSPNTSLNGSLVKMDVVSHSSHDLVGLTSGKTALLRQINYSSLRGNSQCILSLWFLSPKLFSLILSLADGPPLLLRSLLTRNWLDKHRGCESRMKSHLGGALRPPHSSTVWSLMDWLSSLLTSQ